LCFRAFEGWASAQSADFAAPGRRGDRVRLWVVVVPRQPSTIEDHIKAVLREMIFEPSSRTPEPRRSCAQDGPLHPYATIPCKCARFPPLVWPAEAAAKAHWAEFGLKPPERG
jgi:hypothetical protein